MRIAVFDTESASGLKADYSVLICGVVKEIGKSPVVLSEGRHGDNDRELARAIREELEKYDILVGHYSLKHDMPYLNAKLLYWGLPKISSKLHIDTYVLAKRGLQISSRRLGSIATFLNVGYKIYNDPDTWRAAAYGGDEESTKKIIAHCKQDVILTERIFEKLKGFVRGITSAP